MSVLNLNRRKRCSLQIQAPVKNRGFWSQPTGTRQFCFSGGLTACQASEIASQEVLNWLRGWRLLAVVSLDRNRVANMLPLKSE